MDRFVNSRTFPRLAVKENKVEAKSQNPKMIGQATFKFCTFTVFCERMFDHSNQKYIWMYQMLHVTQILKSCPRFEQHSPPCPQLALQEENHICLGTPEIYRNGRFWICSPQKKKDVKDGRPEALVCKHHRPDDLLHTGRFL